jgi:hypothetical protein
LLANALAMFRASESFATFARSATMAILMTSGARLRKATPSPLASKMGKNSTQKTASGSRQNSRKRIFVN